MNDDFSLSLHHQITQKIANVKPTAEAFKKPSITTGIEHFLSMDKLYAKATTLGIEIRFIDPEPYMVSAERISTHENLISDLERKGASKLQAHTIGTVSMLTSTDARGEIMSQRLISTHQSEKNSGSNRGIIAIAGFMHRHFAARVSEHIPSSHVVAFADRTESCIAIESCSLVEKNIWRKAVMHGNTKDFYYSPVRPVNAADYYGDYGFEKFESAFGLRSETAIDNSDSTALMRVLQKLHPEIKFTRNNRFVVSAELDVANEEAHNLLASNLPLRPTVIEKEGQKTLRFSGINLPPQAKLIASWDKKITSTS